jgi:hypothetical protein
MPPAPYDGKADGRACGALALTPPQSPRSLPAMSHDDADRRPKGPSLSAAGQRARAARDERLAAALRANLKRRKAQERGRAADPAPEPAPDPAPDPAPEPAAADLGAPAERRGKRGRRPGGET